jgi:hypothetical protein
MYSDTCVAESPMAKPFESLLNYGSATLYVLMEVASSVGTALRAAIATTIVVVMVPIVAQEGFDGLNARHCCD